MDKAEQAEVLAAVNEEIERKVEEVCSQNNQANQEEDYRNLLSEQVRLQEQGKTFLEREDWKQQLAEIKQMTVIKMPKILQSVMYMLGFTREQICEPKTNKINWKVAKQYIEKEVPARMAKFEVIAEKNGQFKVYQTINFCERALAAHTEEEVAQYHAGFYKLYKWLVMAIDARKTYIARTKAFLKRDTETRIKMQDAAAERTTKRAAVLAEALDRFNEEHKEEI